MASKALGKGLSALIPDKGEQPSQATTTIKTSLIQNNRFQPRTQYDEASLSELKDSIREKGVLQPILVRPYKDGFEVVAGERRLRAAKALNLAEVPVVIKEVDDNEALVIALIENIQREELNPIEEAEAYKRLVDEFGYKQEDVAKSVGKDRSTVTNLLRLLNLPKDIQKGVYDNKISVGHARCLLSVENPVQRKFFYDTILKKELSVRETEQLIKRDNITQRPKKIIKEANPQIVNIEEKLQQLLGTKVRVFAKRKRGKIVIEYYSPQEFERLIKHLIK